VTSHLEQLSAYLAMVEDKTTQASFMLQKVDDKVEGLRAREDRWRSEQL